MKNFLYLSAAAVVFFAAGWRGGTNPAQIFFPATNGSFSQDIEPYFALACVECHDEDSPTPLSTWTEIRSDLGVVTFVTATQGDTLTSELVLVMYGGILHSAPINANNDQRQGIKEWVLEGAK